MNKIKGSSSAVKMKYLLFVFAAAVLVALPTRVYQLLALVDVTNGFYKESDITVPVLYAIAVIFGLLFLVLSFISKEVPSPKLPAGKNPILGIASFVMVGGLAWDMVSFIMNTVPGGTGNASIFVSLFRSNLSEAGGTFAVLQFVFAFFAIIYFTVFAISHLNGRASYKEFKLLALSPLCWVMTMLVGRLMNAISFIKVSELLFEIFMCVFLMLFFLTFARISSGVFTEDSMWGIYGYGLTASMLAAIVTIPRIVIFAVGLKPVEGYDFSFAHFAPIVFILAYIFASLGIGFKDGLKNRRTVSEIELPDDEIIVKKSDSFEQVELPLEEEDSFEAEAKVVEQAEEAYEIVETVEAEGTVEEIPEIEEAVEAKEIIEAIPEAEEIEEAPVAEEIEEEATEAAEAEEPEENTFEIISENVIDDIVPEASKESEKTKKSKLFGKSKEENNDSAEDFAPISLAELKSRQNKE